MPLDYEYELPYQVSRPEGEDRIYVRKGGESHYFKSSGPIENTGPYSFGWNSAPEGTRGS